MASHATRWLGAGALSAAFAVALSWVCCLPILAGLVGAGVASFGSRIEAVAAVCAARGERRGILCQPSKPSRGWRLYDEDALRVVRFVKRAQTLGFTLDEIEQMLRLRRSASPRACARVSERAREKIAEIEAKVRDLSAMRTVLENLAKTCHAEGGERCPILEAFDRD